MKIIVTGSSGTIGSVLCEKLQERGHTVIGVDIKKPQVKVKTIYQDLRKGFTKKIKGIDMVIHLAANARVHPLVIKPNLALDNIKMIHNALEFCRANKIKKFLFSSSRECYGEGDGKPTKEELANQRRSMSPYTTSKIAGESYCYSYENCYGIGCRIMRFSNVYGKYDDSDRFIPKIIRKFINNLPFEIWGENKTLDFTYVDDCVAGIITLVEKWDGLKYKEYNIASGKPSKLIDVAKLIKKELKSDSPIQIGTTKTGEIDRYTADIGRIKQMGWAPKVNIKEGIEKSIGYYVDYYGKKKNSSRS